jgi:hypothetical protein
MHAAGRHAARSRYALIDGRYAFLVWARERGRSAGAAGLSAGFDGAFAA